MTGTASAARTWGQLYLAGYATTDDVAVPNDAMREHGRDRLRRFREALLGLDADGLSRALDAVLDESPSYLDLTSENGHHMLLLGLLYDVPGYRFPRSNRERGDGRPDVTLEQARSDRDALLESFDAGEDMDRYFEVAPPRRSCRSPRCVPCAPPPHPFRTARPARSWGYAPNLASADPTAPIVPHWAGTRRTRTGRARGVRGRRPPADAAKPRVWLAVRGSGGACP